MSRRMLHCCLCALIGLPIVACATAKYAIPVAGPIMAMKDMDDNQKKVKLSQMLMTDPDLPEWQQAREKITLAVGDRVFDSDVESVYKAIVVGVATLEVTVDNMEKESGFVSGKGRILPTELATALRKQRLAEYAQAKGFSASVAEPGQWFTPEAYSGAMEEALTMTITVAEQGKNQSKVKVRFNNVYYPQELEECYKLVWQGIDKQGFLDKALDQPAK